MALAPMTAAIAVMAMLREQAAAGFMAMVRTIRGDPSRGE
jgi:hypothetical protein